MWISRQIRHLEIRPVILSASFGSLRPSRQILRCAQDDRLGFSHPERDEGEAEILRCAQDDMLGFSHHGFCHPSLRSGSLADSWGITRISGQLNNVTFSYPQGLLIRRNR